MDHETEDVLAGEWLSGYRGRMLAVARRFAGRATTAEDIVQQALQVAYNARGQLKKTSATGAWLVRITYSVGLRIRSKRARRQELLREHWLREGDSLEVAGSKADPRVAEVLEAMQGLPASQQEIVRCVLVDGLSDGEIGIFPPWSLTEHRCQANRPAHHLNLAGGSYEKDSHPSASPSCGISPSRSSLSRVSP